MKNKFYLVILIAAALFAQIQAQTKPKVFRGGIAGKNIQMTLTRSGDKLSGTYFYQKIGKDLQLSGTIDADGNFKLEETAPNGAKTGTFSGQWKESENQNGVTLEGEWKGAKAKETWGFYAEEQIINFSGDQKLVDKTFAETNKQKLFEITAVYPELTGVEPSVAANFNKLAKDTVMRRVNEFRKNMMSLTAEDLKYTKQLGVNNFLETSYNVELANDNVISVFFQNSDFEGGAHPNNYSFTLNYDLKNGKELKLADLFKPNSNYLKIISDYSIQKLKTEAGEMSDDEWIKTGAAPEANNFSSWNITDKGVLITFDPYQVAAYAAGPQEVLIPYSQLKNILRDGTIVSDLAK